MNLSLEDVFKFPIFETAKIISGKAELQKNTVEWVSVIESPVENFVRENELVLSTGIGCYTEPHLFFDFVKDVYESGASALAIATGHYIYRIPEEIIDFAEANKFVMIDLPWEIRFADIIHEVTSAINRLQQDELIRLKEVQQELIEMFVTKKPFLSIVSFIEKELGLPLLVMNNKGNVAGGSAQVRDVQRMWNDMKKSEEEEESHHPIFSKMKRAETKDAQLFHMKIQSSEQNQGDFFIVAPPSYKMKLREANLMEQAVKVCALWLTSENAIAENINMLQQEFVRSLIKEKEISEPLVREKAKDPRMDVDLPYECLIGYPENLESLYYEEENNNIQTKNSWLENMVAYIEMELADAAQSIHRQIMYVQEGDKMIVFLQTNPSSFSNGTVNQFLDLVDRRLNKLLPGVIVSWGIGKHRDGILSFYRSYHKAASALEVGRKQKGIGERYHFDNSMISRLILTLCKNEEVQDITTAIISPLVEYDKKREMDLINTFIVYNENAGNVSQAARVLNLHRQSLLYRLRKIESLTNLSLTNPDDVFLLDFSIKIWISSGNRGSDPQNI